jgi:CheY-like chemotaxis protein
VGAAPVCAQMLALIEEDGNSRQVIESLQRSGHRVTACSRYADAIDILEQERFDLVISDVHLENGGSVFDFAIWVKNNSKTSRTPFAMFSFHPSPTGKYLEDGIRTTARLLGVATYIRMDKFDAREFCKQIESLLGEQDQVMKESPKEIR